MDVINKLISMKTQHSNKDVRDRADQALAAIFHQASCMPEHRTTSYHDANPTQQLNNSPLCGSGCSLPSGKLHVNPHHTQGHLCLVCTMAVCPVAFQACVLLLCCTAYAVPLVTHLLYCAGSHIAHAFKLQVFHYALEVLRKSVLSTHSGVQQLVFA